MFYQTNDSIVPQLGSAGERGWTGGVEEALEPRSELMQAMILVVLDRYSGMDSEDLTPAMCELLKNELGARVQTIELVPDDAEIIAGRLHRFCEQGSVDLAVTIGGAGFFPSDGNLDHVRKLIRSLSRPEKSPRTFHASGPVKDDSIRFSGFVCNRTVVVNLPGPQAAAVENLARISPLLKRTLSNLQRAVGPESGDIRENDAQERENI